MSDLSKRFKDCRIMIRLKDDGTMVADTTILKHDTKTNIVQIPYIEIDKLPSVSVKVRIFGNPNLYEYEGTLRKTNSYIGRIEVALYKENTVEDRRYHRHHVDAQGNVLSVIANRHEVKLRRPLQVDVENISANGVLFEAGRYDFRIGDIVRLSVDLQNNKLTSIYEIVRTQNETESVAQFGCRNLLDDSTQERELIEYVNPVLPKDPGTLRPEVYEQQYLQLEKTSGYRTLLEDIDQGSAVELIDGMVHSMEPEKMMNLVHHKRAEQEKEKRHCVNTALIAGFLAKWLELDAQQLHRVVEMGYTGDIPAEENLLQKIAVVANDYDRRAAHPAAKQAAIPLLFLEQIHYEGLNAPKQSRRMLRRVLAERILRTLPNKNIMLANGATAEVLNLLHNDVSRPVIEVNHLAQQLENPWGIMGVLL